MSENMTEAPFSITFKMLDPHGVSNLVTLRSASNELPEVSALLEDKDSLQAQMIENGWTPDGSGTRTVQQDNGSQPNARSSRYGGNRQQNTGNQQQNNGPVENCNCGVPGVKKTGTKKNGEPWVGVFCAKRSCEPIFRNN